MRGCCSCSLVPPRLVLGRGRVGIFDLLGSAVWSSRPFDHSFRSPGSGIPLSLDPCRMDFGSVSLYAFLPSSGVERPLAGLGTFLAMKLAQSGRTSLAAISTGCAPVPGGAVMEIGGLEELTYLCIEYLYLHIHSCLSFFCGNRVSFDRIASLIQFSSVTVGYWSLDCGIFVAEYAKYLSEGLVLPSNGFDAQTHHLRYATLLWNYGTVKARKNYTNDNDDPSRSRPSYVLPLDDAMMVSLE
ncbi:hypothetical protein CQW23_32563 [Capsicum baccatum]|uniref:Ubiquitin-like protease family profile domain-containing protein n=1 Tax=Capsicum baccatum TaxID=33114 RepID=A0A2G2V4B8_CAPBA|nr:hypothetical protein CQW23_32563 [Capsicum baccatum]